MIQHCFARAVMSGGLEVRFRMPDSSGPSPAQARSIGNAITSARRFAPAAIITSRSNPRATPRAWRATRSIAASSRLSSGSRGLPSRRAAGFASALRRSQHVGVQQFVVAVGQFDALDIKLEPLGDRRIARTHAGPAPPGWPDNRTESSAAVGPSAAAHVRPAADRASRRDRRPSVSGADDRQAARRSCATRPRVGPMRIKPDVLIESLRIGQPLGRPTPSSTSAQVGQQSHAGLRRSPGDTIRRS